MLRISKDRVGHSLILTTLIEITARNAANVAEKLDARARDRTGVWRVK